jgi:hypothetical protein
MKKPILIISILLVFISADSAFALTQPLHKLITGKALEYMGSDYADREQKRAYNTFVESAGSLEQAKELLGQAAYDVDSFMDTRMGGWWVGYHYTAEDLSIGLVDNNYTSLWHFINMTRGPDDHGNDYGGYDYRYRTDDPSLIDYDDIVKTWLINQELHDDDFANTEKHYRLDSYSIKEMYEDFQKIPFQPVDNLGQYWFNQFKVMPTFQSIGYVTHAAGDCAVAQHVYNTLSNRHSEYEAWLEDYFSSENLAPFSAVKAELANYNPRNSVQDTLTQTAEDAYTNSSPLFNGSHDSLVETGKIMMTKAMAAIVTILTKGINHLHGEGGE